MNDIYIIAAPERHVLPGGFIDASAGHLAMREDAPDAREQIDGHREFSAETLEVYRCRRDGSWWVVTQ
jgi:hypothetical protein